MRKLTLFAVLALSLLAFAAPAFAQEGQMDAKAMEAMMMQLMTPGAPHKDLARMEGKWTATITMYMEGAQTSEGTYEGEMVLGGRYLLGRYKNTYMGQPYEGLSLDGYDNSKQQFFSMWLDSMGTGYYLAHGTASADGKVVKHQGTMTMGPMEIPSRSETVYVDKDTVKFTMWQSMGGQESKAMEAVYKRVH
ncbi:MAG: DUF1579 family protein [bacterium]|nr:DUF1579 family protein [bacterium]